MEDALAQAALDYHHYPTPGKIAVTPTKGMSNQRDLALAYSPGVAVPCLEIQKDPLKAYDYTAKGNLVAVISNGTAVLGLGNIGAVAGKPVMEGKGCLFKKFAGIDVFDIEIDETDPDKLVETIASLEPTFGGINLEDIKAPECFYIETKLRERMKIPVFHDDQHGTAIVAAAALLNALEVVGKRIGDVKLVCSGAGAAAIACLNIVVGLGVRTREHLGHRQQGRGLRGPHRIHGPAEGAVRAGHARPHAGRDHPGCRRVLRPLGGGRAQAGDGGADGRRGRSSWPWPTRTPRSGPSSPRRCAPTASSPPGARTTRTRSTTSCASRSSSAVPWMLEPPRSTRR